MLCPELAIDEDRYPLILIAELLCKSRDNVFISVGLPASPTSKASERSMYVRASSCAFKARKHSLKLSRLLRSSPRGVDDEVISVGPIHLDKHALHNASLRVRRHHRVQIEAIVSPSSDVCITSNHRGIRTGSRSASEHHFNLATRLTE